MRMSPSFVVSGSSYAVTQPQRGSSSPRRISTGSSRAIRGSGAMRTGTACAGRTLFAEAMARLQLAEQILAAVAELKPKLEAPLMS